MDNLIPVSQGKRSENDGIYTVNPEMPLQAISLVIGNYDYLSTVRDSVEYGVYFIKGHDHFSETLDSIKDTIPAMIQEVKESFENTKFLKYPFNRVNLVEVPVQFSHYERLWSSAQEAAQPELIFIGERA